MKKLYPLIILLPLLITSSSCKKDKLAALEQSLVGSWEIRHVTGGLNPDRTSSAGNGNVLQFTDTDYVYIVGTKVTAYTGTYCVGETGSGRDKEYTLSLLDGVFYKKCGDDIMPKVFEIKGNRLTIYTGSVNFDGTIETYERVKDPVLEAN